MSFRRLQTIVLGIVLLLCGAVSYSSRDVPRHLLPHPIVDLAPRHPWIALTFDDGPHPIMTERLLSMLQDEDVPATFFVVGKMAARYPNLVREIARQGHEVANHTYTHPNLAHANSQTVMTELAQTRHVIRDLTGQDTYLYRPPGGDFTKRTLKVASQAGYHMILWTVLTKDVNGASIATMKHHILASASDGGIVLMHSGIPNTIEMLPSVISELRRQGYHFVTVSQLLGFDHSNGGYESTLGALARIPLPPVSPRPAGPAMTVHPTVPQS